MKIHLLKIQFLLFTTLLCFSSSNVLSEVSAQSIAYACYTCHGEKLIHLNLSQPISAKQLSQKLLTYKLDKTNATIMDRLTKGFSDSELQAVAEYISNTQ